MTEGYLEFLHSKTHSADNAGFDPLFMSEHLYDFQAHLTDWAIRKGRSALFADCGLGKTIMELTWAENVRRKTGGNVLILTCLSVARQIEEEAEKFGIPARKTDDGIVHKGINITNYEKLHMYNPQDFSGVVCDESSILKNFDGKRKTEITEFVKKRPYRLMASATPAPNDFTELGTTSEAIGDLGYVDMLNRYFKNDMNNSARGRIQGEVIRWRFKGHAEEAFWRWVSHWARAIRKPSDLGFADQGFNLPELTSSEHVVDYSIRKDDSLFALPAVGLSEQREERKNTIDERCDLVADIVNRRTDFSIVWCHLNEEGDLLEKIIPGSVQVSGKDSDAAKERKLTAFSRGESKVLITKPKIGAWGLNFQHCNHMTFFPSHSFEQYYQAVRRCWRFGQTRPVHVDIVTSEGERGVLNNLRKKEDQAVKMFDSLISFMDQGAVDPVVCQINAGDMEVPKWIL